MTNRASFRGWDLDDQLAGPEYGGRQLDNHADSRQPKALSGRHSSLAATRRSNGHSLPTIQKPSSAPAGKPRFGPPRMISIRTPGSKSRRTTKELLKQMEHAAQQMVEDSLKDIEFDTCTNIPVDGTGRAIQWDFDIEDTSIFAPEHNTRITLENEQMDGQKGPHWDRV